MPRSFNDELLKIYAQITMDDVCMNNYIVRAKNLCLHVGLLLLP